MNTVLIVGAGPTGLMMACQLALHNIPFRIVEKDSGPTTQSRALGIQARSMEIFQQMGIVDEFLRQGEVAKALNFVSDGKVQQHVPLSRIGEGLTAHPYLFMLEQSKTERILIEFLAKRGIDVEWETEVVSLQQSDKEAQVVIKKKKGEEEQATFAWIVGADGAHSVVRHALGIPLAGKTYKQSLFVLDCKIETDLPKDELSVIFSRQAFAALFPMKDNRWRIVGEVPPSYYGKDEITFAEVEKDFGKRLDIKITLIEPEWISLYHSHHRCVSTFMQGRCFLLGDAAHIHSPVGAQGMNTGLQDAYNLAWKLAFVIQGKANEKLLQTYTGERLPFARKLVNTTDMAFSLIVARNPFSVFFRIQIAPRIIKYVARHKTSSNLLFRTISQLIISYRHNYLAQHASWGDFTKHAPMPGDRLPYVIFTNEQGEKANMQTFVSATKFQLLLFSGKESVAIEDFKHEKFKDIYDVTKIPLNIHTRHVYEVFGLERGYYLIRPDMYIGCRSSELNEKHLEEYVMFVTGKK